MGRERDLKKSSYWGVKKIRDEERRREEMRREE